MKIEEVLARRSDLSTFLVHLCRTSEGMSARDRLVSILRDGCIKAVNPMGQAVSALTKAGLSTESQRTVCFSETPLEHTSLLCQPIEGRNCQFEPFGIAITKKQGRRKGANPVWYLDMTMGHDWLTKWGDALVEAAIAEVRKGEIPAFYVGYSPAIRLAPFIEQMGTWEGSRKEFWWEREWRHVGDFELPHPVIVLCPEEEIPEIRAINENENDGVPHAACIDPRWSLEQIIARTAGFSPDHVGPL